MSDHPELICAYQLDGKGGGEPLDWSRVEGLSPGQGSVWIHLDCAHENAEAWLLEQSKIDTFVIDGLLAEETRPRCESYDEGTLLVLRGVNLNPGAEPEDMVSIRLWITESRVISTRRRKLMAVEDIRKQLAAGRGPVSTGHLVARMSAQMTERMGPAIQELSDQVAELEDRLIGADDKSSQDMRSIRHKLVDMRRVAITLSRYVSPQREALNRLAQLDEHWLDDRVHGRLRETVDRVTRLTEELDSVRERSAVVQDELVSRISLKMEQTMYVLTVVATVMLPLGVLTGLLGVNVGGIPGAETKWAFWAVSGGLVVLVAFEVWLFRRLKWF